MPRPRSQSLQTEIRPRFWSDGIDMRSRQSKKLSRPTRDRDVRDLDYNRDNLKVWTCTNKPLLTETIKRMASSAGVYQAVYHDRSWQQAEN